MWKFMDPGKILEELFDKKTLAVLRHLNAFQDRQFYLRELSRATRVPVATVYRIINKLVRLEIVDVIKVRKFKLYQYGVGKEAKFVEQLIEVRKGAVEEFLEFCRQIENVEQVVLHGKKQKERANLLIIGNNIPSGPLVEAVAKIKETYQFTIIYLTLGPEQYGQMVEMGLYAGDRQVILRK